MLEVKGHRLEAVFHGPRTSPALVFLHEGLGSVSQWRDFPARVAEAAGMGALVYSRLGYGKSDPVPLPRPLRYMHDEAALLPELLRAAGVERPVLVGHSDGASIALIAAGSGVETRGLVLLAPHVFAEQGGLDSIARARDAFVQGDLRARLARHHGDNTDCAFWGWNRAWLDPGFRAWNLEEYLPRIRVPALVLQGVDDEYGTRAQVDCIAAKSGGPVEVALLDKCGHAPQRDQPDETLARIVAFAKALP